MKLDKNIKRKYIISDFDPQWKEQFQEYKKEISEVFKNKALDIQHVGSTSVQGMSAKPLIDILVVVSDIDGLENEIDQMVKLGYGWARDYIEERSVHFYKVKEALQKIVNIHICETGSLKAKQFLVMRDYMRSHPKKVSEYSDLKKKIYKEFSEDYPRYRQEKQTFLENLEQEAYSWYKTL